MGGEFIFMPPGLFVCASLMKYTQGHMRMTLSPMAKVGADILTSYPINGVVSAARGDAVLLTENGSNDSKINL
jgi:hypothetical protein